MAILPLISAMARCPMSWSVLLCLASICVGSERDLSLATKVGRADCILLGTIEAIDRHEVGEDPHSKRQAQRVTLRLTPETILKGAVEHPGIVHCTAYSTAFVQQDGGYTSTTGWNSYGHAVGDRIVIYLRQSSEGLALPGSSGQWIEEVDDDVRQVGAAGQNTRTVPLADKLAAIRRLAQRPADR